jgi:HAD superfamily hydrolase (TIGR01509 family)
VNTTKPDAVLFDMDGTIVDSEPYWMTAERELVEQYGGTWSQEQAYALVGSGMWNTAKLLQSVGVTMEADDIVSHLSARVLEHIEASFPWRPGVRELMKELVANDVPCALVTMSLRTNAEAVSRAVAKEVGTEVFRVIVSANDVEQPKPNPEAYLLAASQLGVDIRHTIALEDSGYGAASAFSAGAVTIGIPLHVEIPSHSAHVLWNSLEGKGLSDFQDLLLTHRGPTER